MKDVFMFYHLSSSMKSSRPAISTQYQHLTSVHCNICRYLIRLGLVVEEFVCRLRPRQWSTFSSLQTARRPGKLGFSPAFQCLSVCLIRFARWSWSETCTSLFFILLLLLLERNNKRRAAAKTMDCETVRGHNKVNDFCNSRCRYVVKVEGKLFGQGVDVLEHQP